jgi:hypothetical protein
VRERQDFRGGGPSALAGRRGAAGADDDLDAAGADVDPGVIGAEGDPDAPASGGESGAEPVTAGEDATS